MDSVFSIVHDLCPTLGDVASFPRILGQTFLRKVYAVFDPWKPAVWLADRRSGKVQAMQKARWARHGLEKWRVTIPRDLVKKSGSYAK